MLEDPRPIGGAGGAVVWQAQTIDPAFLMLRPDGQPLDAGWHVVIAHVDVRSGTIKSPSLYLPGPSGEFSEERKLKDGGSIMHVKTRIEMWPSDLVRTSEYRRVL